jgi:aspartyl-tRNA synthetase
MMRAPTISNLFPKANEDLRLKFRYLDLRRDELSHNLRKRSNVAHLTRNFLHDLGEY